MRKQIIYCLLATPLVCSCTEKPYKMIENGVIVEVSRQNEQQARFVRLQALGDRLIRVSATPEDTFADEQSLIIIPQKEKVAFQVEERQDTILLSTAAINGFVLKSSGEVWFTDKKGKPLLSENKGGGKRFVRKEVDGTKGYSVQQVFESPADEAFYGLGQHQADEFNYKGKNEELFQYNTKVSVPFIVSNRNYGILLDSYSLCRFGNPGDYSQLHTLFGVADKSGQPGAFTGTYLSGKGTELLVRREDSIYFENLKTIRHLPQEFPLNGTQVVYEGTLTPHQSGEYRFILYYAGYMTVYMNDSLVVPERWRTAWNPNSYKFTASLEEEQPVTVRIEWKPDGNESYCGLRAMLPADASEQGTQSWWSEMSKQLDYYFIAGDNMDEVIGGYRTLTGKSPVMPRWAMGYWQSRERYKTSAELLDVLTEFRNRRIPIDNIVLDWSYWPENAWGSHDFDSARFPDPKGMVDSVHGMNARMMISVWPKFYTTTDNYKAFEKNGWIYMQAVKDSLRDWIAQGYHYSFYDAYSADARKLFWQQMYEKLYPLGIDAWWMDASEPNVRDCTDLEYRKALCGPTALGSSTEYFNAYALMNAEAIYDGQRSVDNDKRVFLLTRSGFAGLQRYSTATWSGDIGTRWEDMKAQIAAGLNFAVSGIPYWTMDIGGFCVEDRYVRGQKEWDRAGRENADYKEWRELNARWYQFGAFAPLFRAHGQYPFREVWNIAPENHPAYQSIVYYTQLRYRMMPYIYSLAGKTYFNDYTIMRPLVMDFADDRTVENIGDQFMFGPSFMVSPVYSYGARSREVYFPKGAGWYDFYNGTYREGGEKAVVEAPYERIPLYVKAGSIVPFGPDIQYADEKQPENIVLYVYRGADGSFTLYEDENDNYGYEQGRYAMIPFAYDEQSGRLTIGERKGDFPGMLKERRFTIVPLNKENASPYDPDAKGKIVNYNGTKQVVEL